MTPPFISNICIIGAGPGGSSASIQLSNQGIDHLMVDKAAFPRDKICGDACSGKVVDALNTLGINDYQNIPTLDSWGVTFIAPNGNALRVPFKPDMDKADNAPGFISKRIDFDNMLLQKATAQKQCTFKEKIDLRAFEYMDGRWKCFDKNGDLLVDAQYLIIAEGAQSMFARHIAGIKQEPKHFAAGIRAYYKNVTGLEKDNFIELHFLKEFIPGYFWIFPLPNGQANVGIGLRSDLVKSRKIDLKKKLFELIDQHPVLKERFKDAELVDNVKGFGLPFGSKKRKLTGENYLLVGDAGSLIDPFTGEGIGNAMISGIEAAKAMAFKLSDATYSLEAYETNVYRKLWKELQLSTKLQSLANQKWLFNWLINKATTNTTLSTTISNMFMDLDIRDQLKRPSFYFKLLFN
ncbi:MAG: geranylgeranyl reductase family protein [Chitinophagales bacterium]